MSKTRGTRTQDMPHGLSRINKHDLRLFDRTGQVFVNVFCRYMMVVGVPIDGYRLRDRREKPVYSVWHPTVSIEDGNDEKIRYAEEMYYDFEGEWSESGSEIKRVI